jgi:aminoglycoside phosphotransferase (APT) family kinase protein
MAFVNRLNPADAEPSLTKWLEGRLPGARDVAVTDLEIPSANGRSSETAMFTAAWFEDGREVREQLVARVEPSGEVLFPNYDISVEYQVMKAVGEHTPVQVPAVRWVETDPSVLGAPYLIMDRAQGQAPPDEPPFPLGSWVVDLPPDAQARLYDNALKALAQIHLADPRQLGLSVLADPRRGLGGLDQQIPHYERFFKSAAGSDANPTIEAAFDWVKANRPPTEERLMLSWGDARLGNIMFDPDQSVTAVLDWELAGLGSPELDLGWWLFFDRHHTEGVGAPRPPGFPEPADVVARYEELTGRAVQHLHFYEVFAALRCSVMMVRIAQIMTLGGLLPPGSGMAQSNPASQLLAKTLGLPAPRGPVVSPL